MSTTRYGVWARTSGAVAGGVAFTSELCTALGQPPVGFMKEVGVRYRLLLGSNRRAFAAL